MLRFYAESHVGFLTGFQANRNAADLPGERPWEDRIVESDANVQAAMALQSDKALALVRD